jgi:hypothetical protein
MKMKNVLMNLLMILFMGTLSLISAGQNDSQSALTEVDNVFQQAGKSLPGDVTKYTWPRTDLPVVVAGIKIEPGLALGSWAAFKKEKEPNMMMVMGDLVLTNAEVTPIVESLQQSGFQILAIHNHLMNESPSVLYVHYEGHGPAATLAKDLKDALSKTATPVPSKTAPAKTTTEEQSVFDKVQEALGKKGNLAGHVLQVSVPRKEKIEDAGMEIPPSMGMAISINFQNVDNQVATTGDFVLIADEVNPVIRELTAHGIQVTALHSHMLDETPRLFFLHFWGLGSADKIGEGLKAALSKVNAA